MRNTDARQSVPRSAFCSVIGRRESRLRGGPRFTTIRFRQEQIHHGVLPRVDAFRDQVPAVVSIRRSERVAASTALATSV